MEGNACGLAGQVGDMDSELARDGWQDFWFWVRFAVWIAVVVATLVFVLRWATFDGRVAYSNESRCESETLGHGGVWDENVGGCLD